MFAITSLINISTVDLSSLHGSLPPTWPQTSLQNRYCRHSLYIIAITLAFSLLNLLLYTFFSFFLFSFLSYFFFTSFLSIFSCLCHPPLRGCVGTPSTVHDRPLVTWLCKHYIYSSSPMFPFFPQLSTWRWGTTLDWFPYLINLMMSLVMCIIV